MDQIPKTHDPKKRIKWDPTNKYQSISPPPKPKGKKKKKPGPMATPLVPFETKCVCFLISLVSFCILGVFVRAIGSAVTGGRVSQTWRTSGAVLSVSVYVSFSLCLLAFEHLIVTTRKFEVLVRSLHFSL
jgi:hypothetical protein